MADRSTLVRRLPGLINGHTHGTYGPQYRGIKGSRPFELAGIDLMAREDHPPTPGEYHACALMTALENLRFGNTAVIDHYYGPLTREHVDAVAGAYEEIGIRAWVLLELTDLPWLLYTEDAYPEFSGAIRLSALSDELRDLIARQPRGDATDLDRAVDLIHGWSGQKVRLGLALGNPVWCSDELISEVAGAARRREILVTTHVEESPLQRQISLEQWGLSSVKRMDRCSALCRNTILSHAVQIDLADVGILAERDTSISYNPLSNLKLQVGHAAVGDWIEGGVNVCLGSDGQSSGDCQSLFAVMKVAAAISEHNGLRRTSSALEELLMTMGARNGARFWSGTDLSNDFVELTEPLGPVAHVWDDPVPYIAEVYVDGVPRLAAARDLVTRKKADETVWDLRAKAVAPGRVERAHRLIEEVSEMLERVRPEKGNRTADEKPYH